VKKILLIFFILSNFTLCQENGPASQDGLFSLPNIKIFADYLYCQRDYLRAAGEYEKLLSKEYNDTIEFKIAMAYSIIGDFNQAANKFKSIGSNSTFFPVAGLEFLKSVFQTNDFTQYRNYYQIKNSYEKDMNNTSAVSLFNYSFLFTEDTLPGEENFLNSFPFGERYKMKSFYDWKTDPPEKSPLTAAILSTVIPGAGKIYVSEYADGIIAFLATTVLGYLAYDNFNAGHNFRGWLFSGLAAGFYAGNIYGSAASAQIYNAHIKFDFINELKTYLEDKNYFLPDFNFCK
jgi:TM2 domain-containing membrane protein YozV